MQKTKNSRNKQAALQVVRGALSAAAIEAGVDEGEQYICRNCDVPDKPCVEDPLYECPEKILGGTQFESVRERSRLLMNGEFPRCASCRKKLSTGQLRQAPLSELCPVCRGGARRARGRRREM